MRRPCILLAALGAGLIRVGAGVGQEIDPPYPGAVPFVADQKFGLFQALEVAAAQGVPAEVAQANFSLSAFTTDSAAGTVAGHLGVGAVETYEAGVSNADSMLPAFLASLDQSGLDDLARVVGSELDGSAYRDSLLARISEFGSVKIEYHFVAHEHPDGSLTYYEVHRPFLDIGHLRWLDLTRIRVIRLFPSGPRP
jgi:hypothetical protein